MKMILELFCKNKNPDFKFHDSVTSFMLLEFTCGRVLELMRSFKVLFRGKIPHFLFLGRSVSFQFTQKIKFGKFVRIDNYCYLSALGEEGIRIGNNSYIGAFSRIVVSTSFDHPGKYIRIGNLVGIGEYAYIGGAGGTEIGDGCIIGQYLSCHPENHNYADLDIEIRLQGTTRKGISIGKNCWIGSKVTILDGVSIGEGCVVAAGAVVHSSFPSYSVIGGVPAKLLKQRTR
jgi:acetyltransferase-like isoleucine patch superfamily enzyme